MNVFYNLSLVLLYGPFLFAAWLYYCQYYLTGPYVCSKHNVIQMRPAPCQTLFLMTHQYIFAQQQTKFFFNFCVNKLNKNYILAIFIHFLTYLYVFLTLFFQYILIEIKFKYLKFQQSRQTNQKKKFEDAQDDEDFEELVL